MKIIEESHLLSTLICLFSLWIRWWFLICLLTKENYYLF